MKGSLRIALLVGAVTLAVGGVLLALSQLRARALLRQSEDGRLAALTSAFAPSAVQLLAQPPDAAYETIMRWRAASGFRITLIGPDGRVHADTQTFPDQVGEMENHGNRPEVAEARQRGVGLNRRQSATTNRTTTYLARRLGTAERPLGYLRAAWEGGLSVVPWGRIAAFVLIALAAGTTTHLAVSRWQRRVAQRLAAWSELPVTEDLEAYAGEVDRHVRAMREELENALGVTRAALAEVEDGVVLLDRERVVRFVNAAAQRLLSDQLAEGASVLDAVRSPELLAALEQVAAQEGARHTALRGTGGRELVVRATPLSHPILAASLVIRDASGEVRLERARRALVADLAHELRTPLTVLGGLAEELRAGQPAEDLVSTLERQVGRLTVFAHELEELTMIESGQLRLDVRDVDVREVVRGVISDCGKRASGTGITLRAAGGACRVQTDPTRLAQVLTNLVDNAVRYNRPGGEVAVHVEPAAENVRVRVVDNGLGIPTADLPFVFQRFYRVRRPGTEEGRGLGLAIVKHLVRALGGSVQLASREGEGTEVTLVLPIAPHHVTAGT